MNKKGRILECCYKFGIIFLISKIFLYLLIRFGVFNMINYSMIEFIICLLILLFSIIGIYKTKKLSKYYLSKYPFFDEIWISEPNYEYYL